MRDARTGAGMRLGGACGTAIILPMADARLAGAASAIAIAKTLHFDRQCALPMNETCERRSSALDFRNGKQR